MIGDAKLKAEEDRLLAGLEPTAKALGLRIKVKYDPYNFCWQIAGRLEPKHRIVEIDEEMFLHPGNAGHVANLLIREMEDLQLSLHDAVREHMDAHDRLERRCRLTKWEKDMLHEMLRSAEFELLKPYTYGNEPAYKAMQEKMREFGDLVRRLSR